MQSNAPNAIFMGMLHQSMKMALIAVNIAIRKKAYKMQSRIVLLDSTDCLFPGFTQEKRTCGNGLVDKLRPLRKQIEQLDNSMAKLTAEKAALEQQLMDNPSPASMAEAGRRLKQVTDELAAQEERWLSLSEQVETS